MLHDFLSTHRNELIARCATAAARRAAPTAAPAEDGLPVFLDQLIRALRLEQKSAELRNRVDPVRLLGTSHVDTAEIAVTAMRRGLELSRRGFTIEQVVHDYADLGQAITDLARDTQTPITLGEFTTLHRCLADAIAGAATEFCYQRDSLLTQKNIQVSDERARALLHSLQSHVETATLAIAAISAGGVGLKGATGTILGISLSSMRTLIERSLADAKESIGLLARH